MGSQQMRHERGQVVVVAKTDLLVRDGVVLVDDRTTPRSTSRLASPTVQVLLRFTKSRGARSTWAANSPCGSKASCHSRIIAVLTHGGHGLEHRRV